jgi:FkbM family methyltransferase
MLNRKLRSLVKNSGIYEALRDVRARLRYRRKIRIRNSTITIPFVRGVFLDMNESWMIDLLSELLPQQRGVFLDVGVNVGQTLVKLKAIDPEREYVGFEPNPVCVFYSQNLIKANGFRNCELVPVGLFNENNILTLELIYEGLSDSSASLIKNFRPDNKVYSRMYVPVFRYEVIEKAIGINEVGIVKIDVEGAELEVLRSLSDLIRRDRPIVLLEILPVYSLENTLRKERQEAIEEFLSNVAYETFRVEKTPSGAYAGLDSLSKINIHSDLTQCDYAAIPRERVSALKVSLVATAASSVNSQKVAVAV